MRDMYNTLIRTIGILCLIAGYPFGGSSQAVEQFRVTSSGIAPITMTFDSITTDQIYSGTIEMVKTYCNGHCAISEDGSKLIQVDATQLNAFTAFEGHFKTYFDMKFLLTIKISDHQMNLEYRAGATYPAGQAKPSQLTYVDFFKKNGTVKDNYSQAKESLERSINNLHTLIRQHLKKKYIPKLVNRQHEKGYVQGDTRISLWQYFDSRGNGELVINHTTGKLIYQKPDSARYFVISNGAVTRSKLDVRPMPINGFQNFFIVINEAFRIARPSLFFHCKTLEQESLAVVFEVDTLGRSKNWTVASSTGIGRCDSTILAPFKVNQVHWIPAKRQKRNLVTRLAIPIILTSEKMNPSKEVLESVGATYLDLLTLPIPKLNDTVFETVDTSAEFDGGMIALSKWLAHNLRYPPSARRMGTEGRATVKFIIEPDGAISNVELLRGFDAACDKEAVRVISIMPKWKPGKVQDIPVRQSYIMPVAFRLSE